MTYTPLEREDGTELSVRMKTITKLIYLAFTVVILAIGAVTANGAPNDLFVSVNGAANNGGGFIYEYNPVLFTNTTRVACKASSLQASLALAAWPLITSAIFLW